MMKTKRFCKSTVSLLLVFMMLISMLTVGIVNTSAAEADIADASYAGVSFRGSFNNWGEPIYMTSSNGVYSCTVTVAAGKYQGQVHIDGKNCGYASTVNDVTPSDGYQLITSPDYFEWNASTGGTYTIKYQLKNNVPYFYIFNDASSGGGSGGDDTETFPYELEETDTRALYFVNTGNWSNVYCYSWPTGGNGTVAWPGTKMTKAGSTKFGGFDVYYVQVTAGENNVKFTNNSGTETGNFTFNDFSYYDTTGRRGDVNTYGSTATYTDITVGIATDVTNPESYGIAWLIYGYTGTEYGGVNNARVEISPLGTTADYKLADGSIKTFGLYTTTIPSIFTSYYWSEPPYFGAGITAAQAEDNLLLLTSNNKTQEIVPKSSVVTPTLEYVYLRDQTGSLDDSDADMFAVFDDGEEQQMRQRVDTYTGKITWRAEVPDGATKVTFKRYNKTHTTVWNSTSELSLSSSTNGLYDITNASTFAGSWKNNDTTFSFASDTDITNFWSEVWVDTKGNGNGYDAVRWWKDSNGKYHIFLPSNTPEEFNLYSNFKEFTLSGYSKINRGAYVTLSNITNGTSLSYTSLSNSSTETKSTITFHRSGESVSALFFQTEDQFWTEKMSTSTYSPSDYKDAIETNGSIFLYDEWGNLITNTEAKQVLKKIKGRGNSTFEASMKLYGKYAYNFNLDKKVSLIDGATATKKWCLLANNVDHAMLRNTFTYSLASDIGLEYSPKTRHVDVYDNGEYIGAYTIIEKVEYGEDTLMDGLGNLDDVHEGWYKDFSGSKDYEDAITSTTATLPVNGKNYTYKYWKSKVSGFEYNHTNKNEEVDFKDEMNFLLEHELGGDSNDDKRYLNEHSWFLSAYTGQAVVVKYPEFATQDEMQWIIEMYHALEAKTYGVSSNNASLADLESVIDVDSFAKVYLIQELGLNLDACATSYYMYNSTNAEGDAVLKAGPVWDYDWSFGSYYKAKPTKSGASSNLSNPKQMFVMSKGTSNVTNGSGSSYYNLQAQLAHNANFWIECQKLWTNTVEPAIWNYIDDDTTDDNDTGAMMSWLDSYGASVEMNNIRWNNTYKTLESDDWGTKITADYDKGSYNFKPTTRETSNSVGSSVYNYANTVYYLNDWIKVRTDYMHNEGGLYKEEYRESYECTEISFTPTLVGSTLTVVPSVTIIDKDGNTVDDSKLEWQVIVGSTGEPFGDYPTAQSVELTERVNEVTIGVKIKGSEDWYFYPDESQEIICEDFARYTISDVTLDVTDNGDGNLTLTPNATIKLGDADANLNECTYKLVVNGVVLVDGKPIGDVPSKDVVAEEGVNTFVITIWTPDGSMYETNTITYKYSSIPDGQPVTVTVMFKSSSSYRYRPSMSVDGGNFEALTQSEIIGKNKTQTQSYYWYTCDVEAVSGTPVTIRFKNSYDMNAAYIIESPTDTTLYFGVDNLNTGKEVKSLPNGDDDNSVAIRNFYQTAAHMLMPDPTVSANAYTSIGGTRRMLGDSTLDNSLSIFDATATQLDLVGKEELSETASALADYNLDGVKSIMDVTLTQIYLAQ